jgi:protein-tyrosine phosphatase
MRLLFVCLGNICRSPTAEAVARQARPDWTIDSAGTSDWHIGEPPYGPMIAAAKSHGIEMADLRARQFSLADFKKFDLILAMDAKNFATIEALRQDQGGAKLKLLTDFAEGSVNEVPDPYYTRDFQGCITLIEECIKGLSATYA